MKTLKQTPVQLHECHCGCIHKRTDMKRRYRRNHPVVYYCPKHGHDGYAEKKFFMCSSCNQRQEIAMGTPGHRALCDSCEQEKNTAEDHKSKRIYNCEHYDDCLFSTPKQVRFNCQRCSDFQVESEKLKEKRNAMFILNPRNVDDFDIDSATAGWQNYNIGI